MIQNGTQRPVGDFVSSLAGRDNGDVLVVAANHSDADVVCGLLTRAGYSPQWCNDPVRAERLTQASAARFVATVLCHRARPTCRRHVDDALQLSSRLPDTLRTERVIVVSDCTAEDTVVALLKAGAHHCFNLHESPRVLQVRLEAALRRHGRVANRLLAQGNIRFDLLKRRVSVSGKPVDLSPKEYELACYLFSNRGRVVANSELMTSIWSLPPGMDTRRIDTAACRVRKKLKLDANHGWELKRLRRIGYRLVRVEIPDLPAQSGDPVQGTPADAKSADRHGIATNGGIGTNHEEIPVAAIELA
jgi:DNA-binding response OmpR family regulator